MLFVDITSLTRKVKKKWSIVKSLSQSHQVDKKKITSERHLIISINQYGSIRLLCRVVIPINNYKVQEKHKT